MITVPGEPHDICEHGRDTLRIAASTPRPPLPYAPEVLWQCSVCRATKWSYELPRGFWDGAKLRGALPPFPVDNGPGPPMTREKLRAMREAMKDDKP